MGDGMVLWFVVTSFHGLTLTSIEPLRSEEACRLAARQAQVMAYECVSIPVEELFPDTTEESS